jgi:hypothetical protein
VDGVPAEIADHENVVRWADKLPKNGRIKKQVFYATKQPFQISVDRDSFCNIEAKAKAQDQVPVFLRTGDLPKASAATVADKPPREHALVLPLDPHGVDTKLRSDLKAESEAALFNKHNDLCEALASIGYPDRPYRP